MTPDSSSSSTLLSDLAEVVGDKYVIWKPEDLLVYEYDGSIDKATPQAVVLPETADQVSEIVRIANRHGAYIVARGAGTSLSGGAVPLRNSVVLALTRLTKMIEVDAENRFAIVEPGTHSSCSNRADVAARPARSAELRTHYRSGPILMMTTARRFAARPSRVSLDAAGSREPRPSIAMRFAPILWRSTR